MTFLNLDRTVGSKWDDLDVTSIIRLYAGGSSSVLSRAFWAARLIKCASSIIITRKGASTGEYFKKL